MTSGRVKVSEVGEWSGEAGLRGGGWRVYLLCKGQGIRPTGEKEEKDRAGEKKSKKEVALTGQSIGCEG